MRGEGPREHVVSTEERAEKRAEEREPWLRSGGEAGTRGSLLRPRGGCIGSKLQGQGAGTQDRGEAGTQGWPPGGGVARW